MDVLDFDPDATDLADDVSLTDDVDAWINSMLTPEDDQDQDDPYGLGADPYAENTREKTEDEVWGDDSGDHTYTFEVEVRKVTPVTVVTPVVVQVVAIAPVVTPVVSSASNYREALRTAGVTVGSRGRLSPAQVAQAQALLNPAPSASDYREALRNAGVTVGVRGRLSTAQVAQAQALLGA